MSEPVSAIVIQFGSLHLLERLVASLAGHPDAALVAELIVVDNGQSLPPDWVAGLVTGARPLEVRVVGNPETSYASGVNLGASVARHQALLIMNNDIEWLPGHSITPLLASLARDGVGVVGPQLVFADGTWQRSFGDFPSLRSALRSATLLDTLDYWRASRTMNTQVEVPRLVEYVDGAFMLVRRECFAALGGFDTASPFYAEDADFCYRARAIGWQSWFEPRARVLHLRGASSSKDALTRYTIKLLRGMAWFVRKHRGPYEAEAFVRLYRLAMWERAVLYEAIARWDRSTASVQRAKDARTKYQAAVEYGKDHP
jgi:N-acetylglucosaminyl-diphospho-decaprenol L-rhamnosyltransferase